MKTSHILIALIAVITLTGMIATDVLLKQQYNNIDWSNPYQDFERRALPSTKHVVIEGAPTTEIIVEQSTGQPQALIEPTKAKLFRIRQQGDTTYVAFTPDFDGRNEPRDAASYELPAGMVLRLPDLQSMRITNGRLTLRKLKPAQLAVSLQNTRLRTSGLTVANAFELTERQNSFAVLGADHYQSLRTVLRDSSGVQLNDTRTAQFSSDIAPKAEIQLRGLALRWLTK